MSDVTVNRAGDAVAPPLTKGERTRANILDSAQQLFAQSGYKSVSLREIAAKAGVTHAGVLHHFDSRDDVLLALLARRDALQIGEVVSSADPERDPAHVLRVSQVIVEQNARDPLSIGLFVKLSAEATDPTHPAHAYFRHRYRTATATFSSVFGAWLARHDDDRDPVRLARMFIALSDGLQLQWALDDFSDEAGATMVSALASFLALIGFVPTSAELEQERAALRARGFEIAEVG